MNAPESIFKKTRRSEWTTVEVAKLKEIYPQIGAKKAAEVLGRTAASVQNKAQSLKLRAPQQLNMTARFRTVPPEIDAQIRAFLVEGNTARGAIKAFCEAAGYTRAFVRSRALVLGLQVPNEKAAAWTPEEEALLEEVAELSPCAAYRRFKAAGFKRSMSAICCRRNRNGLLQDNPEILTQHALSRMLGVDETVVMRWVRSGGLKTMKGDTPAGVHKRIDRADFRRWAKGHAHELAKFSRRADQQWLIETLLGV